MKKIACLFTGLLLAARVIQSAEAAGMSARLTGPGTVRAGDTVTLSLELTGSKLVVVQGQLAFDAGQLEYKGEGGVLPGWKADIGAAGAGKLSFLLEDDKLSAPINGTKRLFTVRFKVKSAAPGAKLSVTAQGVSASDGSGDFSAPDAAYSVTVSPPLSSNNQLASLTVSNAAISPAFSAGVYAYSTEVPFSVSKLEVSAAAADEKAKAAISSPSLAEGGTTSVTVTVTAENGAKRMYTIKVKRAQDPNYVPAGNNNLASLTVEGFLLSPAFDPNVTSYIVWLPYETGAVKAGGRAADGKASVSVSGGGSLEAGKDNLITVTCTAENGQEKKYTVTAKRAPAHGAVSQAAESAAESAVSKPPSAPASGGRDKSGVPVWLTAVLCAAFAAAGGGAVIFIQRAVKRGVRSGGEKQG